MKTAIVAPSRRQFVRTFTLGSVGTVVGAPWIGTLLATLIYENRAVASPDGELNLQLSNFPPLLQPLGSVRVSVNPISGAYPTGDFYPLIITRGSVNDFYAVSSKCTHRGCVVSPFDGSVINCPCHGSQFAFDGGLLRGPASSGLLTYSIHFDGVNTLKITVLGLGYSITNCKIVAGSPSRIQLDFPTNGQVNYEVRFRPTATAPWSVVPFATSASGATTNTVLTGDGLAASVFVEKTAAAGFYCIAIQVKEV
jgi:Rieske Fe-S protein